MTVLRNDVRTADSARAIRATLGQQHPN